jgi:DNA-binding transcriptional LysR family regulator
VASLDTLVHLVAAGMGVMMLPGSVLAVASQGVAVIRLDPR